MNPYEGEPAPKGGWKFKKHSSHVARIRFEDGNPGSWYTRDWTNVRGRYSEDHGLADLKAGLLRYQASIREAIIYEKVPQDYAKFKFEKGRFRLLDQRGSYARDLLGL